MAVIGRCQYADMVTGTAICDKTASFTIIFAITYYEKLYIWGASLVFLKEPHINTDTYNHHRGDQEKCGDL